MIHETLPYFMMLGVSESRFWDSTPVDLEPYRRMDEMREERNDYHNWMLGQYIMSAVQTAVSGVLAGRKSKAKYIEQPLSALVKAKKEEHNPQADFNRFAAWAVVYNEQFDKKNKRQG